MDKTHCKRGHLWCEFGFINRQGCRECRECKAASHQSRKAKNPEKSRAAGRASNKAWRDRNPEKKKAKDRAWRAQNPEKKRASSRAWAVKNPEKARAKSRASARKRRALKLDQLGFWPISEAQFVTLLFETDPNCYYCRTPLSLYHLEHKIPLSRPEECPPGKKLHEPWNIRLACVPCNLKKGNKTAEEFRDDR